LYQWAGVPRESNDVSKLETIMLIQSLSLWGYPIPVWLQGVYSAVMDGSHQGEAKKARLKEKSKDNEIGKVSPFESKVVGLLRTEMPEICADMRQSHYIDGFELDIYLPRLKFNVEIDGKHHSKAKNQRRDLVRDKHLLTQHGIVTRRISTITTRTPSLAAQLAAHFLTERHDSLQKSEEPTAPDGK